MNILVWGNSHLAAFREAWRSLHRGMENQVVFLPTPNVANRAAIISGATDTANLTFADGRHTVVPLPPTDHTSLIIVGNGNFGHFNTFERQGGLPPLWVYSPALNDKPIHQPSRLADIPPVSWSLFRHVYSDLPLQSLLQRPGFTTDYFRRFLHVSVLVSPTPGKSFFDRQRFSQHYLEAGCLNHFKSAYFRLYEQEINGLSLHTLTVHAPPPGLEAADGTTAEPYLLAEELQVHANEDYWRRRIQHASLPGAWPAL